MKLLIALAAVAAVVAARPGYSSYDSALSYDGHGAGYAGYHGPAAPLAHDGRVVETPEVAHAKAAHLAAHAEAAAKASWGAPADEDDYGHSGHLVGYATPAAYGEHSAHAGHGYHGPPAPLDHKGRVIDTPDVAHLKAAHLAAHAEALANAHHSGGYEGEGYYGGSAEHGFAAGAGHAGHAYHGPPAPLAHDGRVVDTPEVAHAKAAHLAAHAAASDAHGHGYYHGYAPVPAAYNKWFVQPLFTINEAISFPQLNLFRAGKQAINAMQNSIHIDLKYLSAVQGSYPSVHGHVYTWGTYIPPDMRTTTRCKTQRKPSSFCQIGNAFDCPDGINYEDIVLPLPRWIVKDETSILYSPNAKTAKDAYKENTCTASLAKPRVLAQNLRFHGSWHVPGDLGLWHPDPGNDTCTHYGEVLSAIRSKLQKPTRGGVTMIVCRVYSAQWLLLLLLSCGNIRRPWRSNDVKVNRQSGYRQVGKQHAQTMQKECIEFPSNKHSRRKLGLDVISTWRFDERHCFHRIDPIKGIRVEGSAVMRVTHFSKHNLDDVNFVIWADKRHAFSINGTIDSANISNRDADPTIHPKRTFMNREFSYIMRFPDLQLLEEQLRDIPNSHLVIYLSNRAYVHKGSPRRERGVRGPEDPQCNVNAIILCVTLERGGVPGRVLDNQQRFNLRNMKVFIVLSALAALAAASPSAIVPYGYHAGAPLGHDGRVVDTPEVAHAKAAHLAAHAHEAAKTAGYGHGVHGWAAPVAHAWGAPAYGNAYGYAAAPLAGAWAAPALAYGGHYAHGAPLGHDGRVVDTPEVAHAKAAHLAAHAQEAAKTVSHGYGVHGWAAPVGLAYAAPAVYGHGYGHGHAAPIGHDGRVVDTPEVAHAKAAHFAAHAEANSRAHYW
ncbi:uncharacterized protein LOC124409124 [Diprion similis]|uniref:uncharacterized protein LOC124409124 n=1 Tax=Diprion similis TaxID=362088 RepID=UPI001EF87E41|nr:uncharacterized protein LOC124409124 [Diprion similis]